MIRHGTLQDFDSGTYIATVQLAGSIGNYIDVATSRGIVDTEMTTGRRVLVVFLDEGNPGDAVLTAVWE